MPPPTPGGTLLFDCLSELLETVVDALVAPPEKQMVADGDPMQFYADCPFVATWQATGAAYTQAISTLARGRSIPPRPTSKTSTSIVILNATVLSTACYPIFDTGPSFEASAAAAADVTAASAEVLTDREDVWARLRYESTDGTMFSTLLAGNDGIELAPPVRVVSSGGAAGSLFSVGVDWISLPDAS